MVFYDSNWQDCQYTGIITGAYIVFYQGVPNDHFTHITGTVDQSSAYSEYNAACTSGMATTYFRVINNELLQKDLDFPQNKHL